MSFCVDHLEYTIFKDTNNYDDVLEILFKTLPVNLLEDIALEDGMLINSKRYKYNRSILFDNGIQAYFDGMPGMGIHVILHGSTLNNTVIKNDIYNIIEWYERIKQNKYGFNVSRIDMACDTEIDFSYFLRKCRNMQFVCSSQKLNYILDNNDRGTIYIGARGNPIFFRIYDKDKEQTEKNKAYISEGTKTRIELECRNRICKTVLDYYCKGEIGQVFKKKLLFVNRRVNNMSRDAKGSIRYLKAIENPIEKADMKLEKLQSNTDRWMRETLLPVLKAYQTVYDVAYIDMLLEETKASEGTMKRLKGNEILLRKSKIYKLKNRKGVV
jgi:hypothetical protein